MRYVVLGEALIDLIPEAAVSSAESTWTARSGGSPMNVAVALARLGEETSFLGKLSEDTFGRQLRDHLSADGVALDLTITTADPTALAVVSLDGAGVASYAFHLHGTTLSGIHREEFPSLMTSDWLHIGSIGAVLEPGYAALLDFVRGAPCPISYDLNVRPSVFPDRDAYMVKIDELLAAVGVSGGIGKASDEDLIWLADGRGDPLEVAAEFAAAHGLAWFVVTLGADGAAAVGPEGAVVQVSGHRVDVVDTVGAGDTFMAGFLSAYGDGDVEAGLRCGVDAAALVCTRPGAQPPTRNELADFLR